MASTPAPPVKSPKERTNYARLCCLLVDIGSQALRDTFDAIHPPAGLYSVLASGTQAHNTLQLLRNKRILNPTQWAMLYPAVSPPVSSKKFDITLLVVLLRNICNLTPPAAGWDSLPSPADTSTAANIARVKFYRNTVYAHATQASVDDATFNTLWKDIRKVLVALGGASYGAVIDKLRFESMDPNTEEECKKLLKQWKEYEDSIKEQLEKMEGTIRNELEQMRSDLGDKLDTLITQREAQDEDRRDLKEMKEKLNQVSTRDQLEELRGLFAALMSRHSPAKRKPNMEGASNCNVTIYRSSGTVMIGDQNSLTIRSRRKYESNGNTVQEQHTNKARTKKGSAGNTETTENEDASNYNVTIEEHSGTVVLGDSNSVTECDEACE